MTYEYRGSAINRLFQSYQRDEEPFIEDTTIKFPQWHNGFEEIRLLKELFFPNYWNYGSITKPENKTELGMKVNELGQAIFHGIKPYLSDEKAMLIVDEVLNQLPAIRELLKKDVEAAYKGDLQLEAIQKLLEPILDLVLF